MSLFILATKTARAAPHHYLIVRATRTESKMIQGNLLKRKQIYSWWLVAQEKLSECSEIEQHMKIKSN